MSTPNQAGTAAAGPYEAPRAGADPKWWTLAAVCLGTFMLLLDSNYPPANRTSSGG